MRWEVTCADGRLEVAGEEEARLNSTPTVNSHETIAIDAAAALCTVLVVVRPAKSGTLV